jgi:predicted enzyme related to lactoylglutathione lyase
MFTPVFIEIPVLDLARALAFYEAVFALKPLMTFDDGVRSVAVVYDQTASGGVGISLNQTAGFQPGDRGPLVYLKRGDALDTTIARIADAGGAVVEGKTAMGENSYYATFRDSEGNLLAVCN